MSGTFFAQVRKTAPVSVLPNYPTWPPLFFPPLQERTEPYFSVLLASVLDLIHPVSPIIKKRKK